MINMYSWDDTKRVIVAGNLEETVSFSAKHFIESAKKAIDDKGFFSVALSGGSTPKLVYEYLAKKYAAEAVWKNTYLLWSDERSVPSDHPDSNYHMAMQSGFSKLPIPKDHIFRMQAESEIDKHASEYEKLIKKYPLDLTLLGMGEDGHTASLFPNSLAINEKEKLVTSNYIDSKKTWRMTLTFKAINASKASVFYVLGASKKQRLLSLFHEDPPSSPALFVGTNKNPALWILDEDAAHLIKPFLAFRN